VVGFDRDPPTQLCPYEAVESGAYAFEEGDLPELKARFVAWIAEREAAAKARAEPAATGSR
jgi:hypothetical protein